MHTKVCTKCGRHRRVDKFRVLRTARSNRVVRHGATHRTVLAGDPIYHPWCRDCEKTEKAHKTVQRKGVKQRVSTSSHTNVPLPAEPTPDYEPTLGDA